MVKPMLNRGRFNQDIENAALQPQSLLTAASVFDEASMAAEKIALRALLDSFHTQPETLLEQTLRDPATRHNIGRCIGYTIVKPYEGER